MKSRSKILQFRELCGNIIPSRKGKFNFQTTCQNKQASQPLVCFSKSVINRDFYIPFPITMRLDKTRHEWWNDLHLGFRVIVSVAHLCIRLTWWRMFTIWYRSGVHVYLLSSSLLARLQWFFPTKDKF